MPEDLEADGLNILVVDNNADAAWALSTLLEMTGHHAQIAHNGLDAVKAAMRKRYDAVVLDLCMPIMDGFEAGALLTQLDPAPLLIACSAWDDPEARRRTADLGFAAHLPKSVPFSALQATLKLSRTAEP